MKNTFKSRILICEIYEASEWLMKVMDYSLKFINNMSNLYCTACGDVSATHQYVNHPLLVVPICNNCLKTYCSGEFTLDEEGTNEIFCRWCGEGLGELCLCDTCPRAFCTGCITRNFGQVECTRILSLSNRWSCYLCSPQLLVDLCTKNEWGMLENVIKRKEKSVNESKSVIYSDISHGRENFEIPVINTVDKAGPPLDFIYITRPIPGDGVVISNNPNLISCCSCVDNCSNPKRCECILQMDGSIAYDEYGKLVCDKTRGIYECNDRCACHVQRCKNRIVSNGPKLKLEVFRCSETDKGWGLRCKSDITAGSYICDYIGEVIPENVAEYRGLGKSVCC